MRAVRQSVTRGIYPLFTDRRQTPDPDHAKPRGVIMSQERRPLLSEILSQHHNKIANEVRQKIDVSARTELLRSNNDRAWWLFH